MPFLTRRARRRLPLGPDVLEDRCVPASVAVHDVAVLEGNQGPHRAVFAVTLSAASRLPVSVHYTTVDGTATAADHDYRPAHGTLTFRPGQTRLAVAVPVV